MQITKNFFVASILLLTFTFATACLVSSGGGGKSRRGESPSRRSVFTETAPLALAWHPVKGAGGPKAVALVVHGLNLLPKKMEPLISFLTKNGVEVVNLSLSGHAEDRESGARLEALKEITYPLWSDEIHHAYEEAAQRSGRMGVPLVFVGFSLGGLLGVDLMAAHWEVRFQRMVLLAPALKIRPRSYVIRLLSLFPKLTLPSFAPKSYQANEGTPIAAYNALFEALSHFEKNISPRINVPTLVLVDKQDEFISVEGIQRLMGQAGLDQWKLCIIEKRMAEALSLPHHLIIDENSLGRDLWNKVAENILQHLTPSVRQKRKAQWQVFSGEWKENPAQLVTRDSSLITSVWQIQN